MRRLLFGVVVASVLSALQGVADNSLTADEKKAGWMLLFNGETLDGWKADKWNPGGFAVEEGALKCSGKRSMLYYDGAGKEMKDFHFIADVKTMPNANSGIFFHTKYQDKGWPPGHEAQVNTSHADPVKTGSIYIVAKHLEKSGNDGEWFRYEIIVRGNEITTKVDGKLIKVYREGIVDRPRKLSSGTIGLQAHDPGSVVYYKNIKVKPLKTRWFEVMDFGPALQTSVSIGKMVVLKGVAARLGADRASTMLYDTEMMSMNAAWEGWLKIQGTPWDGRHGGLPAHGGSAPLFLSETGPGWAKDGSFKDPREAGYGPLPKEWLHYKGRYVHGDQTVLAYTVGETLVWEMPAREEVGGQRAYTRTFHIAEASEKLTLRVINMPGKNIGIMGAEKVPGALNTASLSVGVIGKDMMVYQPEPGQVLLNIAKGAKDVTFKVVMADKPVDLEKWPAAVDLTPLTQGGGLQWPGTFKASGTLGTGAPYATDDIPLPPSINPWMSKIRFSGFDFFADGTSLAAVTWNGDVWVATGITAGLENVVWKRYAAGLFETLGLKIVDDVVYVTGKDQITRLHDLNKDGEADFYECFNNDIMITRNFHEFTFDLQTDPQGNFYFAKAAPVRKGGRGFGTTHAHHGIVFKVSKDGETSEVFATGFRAPGGMGVGPNGEVTAGENEGTYVPACKINWVTKGSFAGVIHPGNGRTMDQGYDEPLCWMPMPIDNSGGGQVWVAGDKWGVPAGTMLHLSYGRSTVYRVLQQDVDGVMQGGVVKLPVKLSSSAMRGRFNAKDGQLYVSGFKGWQTNASRESAIQRIRYTGKPVLTPMGLRVTDKGVYLSFEQTLDKELAEDLTSYAVHWWNYLWSPQYGSGWFSVDNPDPERLALAMKKESKGGRKGPDGKKIKFLGDKVSIVKAVLQADGKTVFLDIPTIRTVMQMRIKLDVETTDGDEIVQEIYNTIHVLPKK